MKECRHGSQPVPVGCMDGWMGCCGFPISPVGRSVGSQVVWVGEDESDNDIHE